MTKYLDQQPLVGEFETLYELDQRSGYADGPLLVNHEHGSTLRLLTDFEGLPITDRENFAERVSLLREVVEVIPSATFMPYFSSTGGSILTRYVEGPTATQAFRSLKNRLLKPEMTQVVLPFIKIAGDLTTYYQDRLPVGEPVVVDLFKSSQYVVGSSGDSKPGPLLIDHDAHVVSPDNNGEYSDFAKLMLLDHVAIQATALAIFLENLSKTPEIKLPFLFSRVTDSVLGLLATTSSIDFSGLNVDLDGEPPLPLLIEMLEEVSRESGICNEEMQVMRFMREMILEQIELIKSKQQA